ncbi:type II secretion system F family protein [Heliorestis acidaminivorans]|uniref:Type II secretion system F family protein n=1 Tax=Heliorestis acidaminivorans TaxID=553427 RepID=A0A6I0F5S4_9FIRM|nr:type II secretion system F family protein [Heliorestis acidaminivorans]KAB2952639.1 type II secretion system F family protein [Heliorestis acidaminivorans]
MTFLLIKAQQWQKSMKSAIGKAPFFTKKVNKQDLAFFCSNFALLIRTGIPIYSALTILEEQTEHKSLRQSIAIVREEVRKGQTLSEALSCCPQTFPILFVQMIETAELGGILDDVLSYMSIHLEKESELIKKVQTALFYPVILLIASIAVVFFVLTFIMPLFADMLIGLGADLPLITSLLLSFSFFLQDYGLLLLLLFLIALLTYISYPKSEAFLYRVDKLLLKSPIIGTLLSKVLLARFCRTLGTLLGSGIPLTQSLAVLRKTVGNRVLIEGIDIAVEAIHRGENFSTPLRSQPFFPNLMVQMVTVGEETGSLDSLLLRVAEFYEKESSRRSERLSTLLEPLLMLFMGTMVTVLVLSMLLPMFEVIDLLGI